ncbi:MAG: hypothetical protein KatS3mg002_1581 [Candidatus Woesearchaeota archaeon]|nr:MAG: hypothetical protein KatS3mg002_1581 [Candidatus Woesearchaeota archaeon]
MSNREVVSLGTTVIPLSGNFKNKGAALVKSNKGAAVIVPGQPDEYVIIYPSNYKLLVEDKVVPPYWSYGGWCANTCSDTVEVKYIEKETEEKVI